MNRYRNPALRQLAEQQMRYSPRDIRLAQIARAESIVPSLDPSQQYRYVDLCERITSFRTDRYPDLIVSGEEALHDLRCFVEDLSQSVGQSPEQAGEPVLSLAQVCERFQVSEKTVQRWRDRGLVSRWFRAGNRLRLGFLESAVIRFADSRPGDVQRGLDFRPVQEDEKRQILRKARRLARHGATLAEIGRRLSRRFHRSPETIRYTVRDHDRQHPAAAVFPQWRGRLSDDERKELYRSARRGVPAERLARQYRCTKSSVYRVIAEERARRLLDQTIEFIPCDDFELPDAAATILSPDARPQEADDPPPAPPPELPPYLAALYNIPVLTREQEDHCFRKFNFLKFQAVQWQRRIDPKRPLTGAMDQMEESLRFSHEVKNFLIRSNLRLVVSIARRHLKPGGNFFEMVSDGNMALISAIERFDFRRGNKFSTYGTWVVMKAFARAAPLEATFQQRFHTGSESIIEQARESGTRSVSGPDPRQQQALVSILSQLDPRERAIIMYRFGIGVSQEPETLDQVGKRLGVTKERIRQLEQRALQKLRQLAVDERLELPDTGP